MNESVARSSSVIEIVSLTRGDSSPWGKEIGDEVSAALVSLIEATAQDRIYLSLRGVGRIDASFARRALVSTAKHFRQSKIIIITNADDIDIIENIEVAADRLQQPMYVLASNGQIDVVGGNLGPSIRDTLKVVLNKRLVRAADVAVAMRDMSVSNVSNKLKQLWSLGMLLRRDAASPTGGVEFLYEAA